MSLSITTRDKIMNRCIYHRPFALTQNRVWKKARSLASQPAYPLQAYEAHLQENLNASYILRYQVQAKDIMTGG